MKLPIKRQFSGDGNRLGRRGVPTGFSLRRIFVWMAGWPQGRAIQVRLDHHTHTTRGNFSGSGFATGGLSFDVNEGTSMPNWRGQGRKGHAAFFGVVESVMPFMMLIRLALGKRAFRADRISAAARDAATYGSGAAP